MSELSHFEALSTKVPIKQPVIGICAIVLLAIFFAVLSSILTPDLLEDKKAKANETQTTQTQSLTEEPDEL